MLARLFGASVPPQVGGDAGEADGDDEEAEHLGGLGSGVGSAPLDASDLRDSLTKRDVGNLPAREQAGDGGLVTAEARRCGDLSQPLTTHPGAELASGCHEDALCACSLKSQARTCATHEAQPRTRARVD